MDSGYRHISPEFDFMAPITGKIIDNIANPQTNGITINTKHKKPKTQ